MSRMGNRPIEVPDDVEVTISGDEITASGPEGELTETLLPGISVSQDDGELMVNREDDSKQQKSRHGLMWKLVKNIVEDANEGFSKTLELNGIGYRTRLQGSSLVLELGYSHPIEVEIPDEIDVDVPNNTTINISGIDRQQVGEFSAQLRQLRDPDPYNQKGIKYEDEFIRQKVGKAVGGEGVEGEGAEGAGGA